VKRIEDPIGLLPAKLILGINKRGVHFFRPVPKEYLHSAELRDIMQFGSSSQAVFFKMRVAGVLHIFQFDTKQGEDICMALQTHINDIMMKRYSKVWLGGITPCLPAVLASSKTLCGIMLRTSSLPCCCKAWLSTQSGEPVKPLCMLSTVQHQQLMETAPLHLYRLAQSISMLLLTPMCSVSLGTCHSSSQPNA